MAISEETAALVAAQLTVAWATRAGVQKADPARPFEEQVLATYKRFVERVSPPPGKPYNIDAFS